MKNTTAIALTSLFLMFTASSNAAVTSSSEHGFQIKLEQAFSGSAQEGYERFVNNINSWWLNDHTWFGDASRLSLNATAGGCFVRLTATGRLSTCR